MPNYTLREEILRNMEMETENRKKELLERMRKELVMVKYAITDLKELIFD